MVDFQGLLIREVQWCNWTQELLVPVEKFTVSHADGETRNRNPRMLLSCVAQWLEHSVYNRGVASSSFTIGKINLVRFVSHRLNNIVTK